ncbi:putative signal transducing protein [Litoribacter populi]|uniref:putative signal transducing protein n=1 Tax=Litoribacter populi TaxID=2598460 RepID=UPI00117C3194|nr:DUF2007 domain-containing protein [Litoribacter populi]
MGKWQTVTTIESPVRAEIIKGVLEQHGIMAMVINKKESVYHIHGHYEILVLRDQALQAANIIKNEITF